MPRFETLAIKSTEQHFEQAKPVSPPIYLSTTYERNQDGSYNHDLIYTRSGNPNRMMLEKSLALLEGGEIAYAFASGMAAISAVFQSLKTGDHVILPDDVYYQAFNLVPQIYERWGLEVSLVDMTDLSLLRAEIKPNTALIWLETPSNPQLKISDISTISQIAKEAGALCIVDNTWPTPVLQNPLELGADAVMHSTSKYIGGHSDVLSGCLILKENGELAERIKSIQLLSGGVPSPFDCWLLTRGIQTMHLRVMAQTQSAHQLALFLDKHPKIASVNYPGLSSHPQHEIAKKQMTNGFGAMLSVLIKGDGARAMDIASRLQYFTMATSLGGVESLVEHRKSVEGPNSATPDNLLRLSVGLENIEDLKEDWERALSVN